MHSPFRFCPDSSPPPSSIDNPRVRARVSNPNSVMLDQV
jgi:hypothetical protein